VAYPSLPVSTPVHQQPSRPTGGFSAPPAQGKSDLLEQIADMANVTGTGDVEDADRTKLDASTGEYRTDARILPRAPAG